MLFCQQYEFWLRLKVMGSNPGYLLTSFLLYKKHFWLLILEPSKPGEQGRGRIYTQLLAGIEAQPSPSKGLRFLLHYRIFRPSYNLEIYFNIQLQRHFFALACFHHLKVLILKPTRWLLLNTTKINNANPKKKRSPERPNEISTIRYSQTFTNQISRWRFFTLTHFHFFDTGNNTKTDTRCHCYIRYQ